MANPRLVRWLHALGYPSDRALVEKVRAQLSQREQLQGSSFAKRYFPEEKQAIAERLFELTQKHCRAPLIGLIPDDRFVEDFQMDMLDSMSLLELVLDVEKAFGIEIPDETARRIRTFGQLVDTVSLLKSA
jgi:acyl carrier protein